MYQPYRYRYRYRYRHPYRYRYPYPYAINQPFIRQTPARYADGISTVGGVALASPRVTSNLLFPNPDEGVPNNRD
jgi:hypothetical protein